jgi:hypothetical protein
MHDEEDVVERDVEPIGGVFTPIGKASMVPPDWIVEQLLPPGLTFLAGPPKSMKSTLTMALASLVAGYDCRVLPPFLSVARHTGPVMIFSAEATAGELRHMVEVGLRVKIPKGDETILIADDPWAFRLDDDDALDMMQRWVEMIDPRVVIIDPLRDFHEMEEKDSGQMNRLLRPLRQWAVNHDGSVIIVHHTRKPAESANAEYSALDMRGTSALFGIADGVLVLSPKKDGLVTIKATFKRAQGWERTIKMAAYDVEVASEVLGDVDRNVLKCVELGAGDVDTIAEQLHIGRKAVTDCIERLARNGYITKESGTWRTRKLKNR